MSSSNPPKAKARAPQRANGIKRRNAILEAAADIIAESGIAGLTLHAAAQRANSSVGSMYHFFGDKNQLLDALRDSHRKDMQVIMAGLSEIAAADWQKMSAHEVIDALFGRAIHYYSDHPFALELHDLREEQAADAFLALVKSVMTLRLGSARGVKAASLLYAVSTGTLSFILGGRDTDQRSLVPEIPAVLTVYLAGLESA